MEKIKKYITGYFEDETDLLKAIDELKKKEVKIHDVQSPFPVHGLDEKLKLKKSRIPTIGFLFGAIGAIAAFGFQAWTFHDYPLNIGGKPLLSVPSFIPVTFEVTVLFAAFGMAFYFFFRSKLGFGAENVVFDPRATDDHFVVVLDANQDEPTGKAGLESLESTGAKGVKLVEVVKNKIVTNN